jgi:hypothetical protein
MSQRWFVLMALVVGSAVLFSACAGRPQISVTEKNLNVGDVVNGEVVKREVTVQNAGQADLVITSISTSCGCTKATLEPMTIPPGASGTLQIEFDSGAHGPDLTGALIRQIFIVSNDPQQPEMVVELAANILLPDAQQFTWRINSP